MTTITSNQLHILYIAYGPDLDKTNKTQPIKLQEGI